jgi:transposase
MSTRVYLSKNPCQTTQEEKTPVCIRRQASHATVKALQARLQDAYRRDEVRLVRRISVLLELLTQTASVTVLCERWGLSPSCLYDWQKAFLWRGMDSLVSRHRGGRPEKLTPGQQKRLVELIEAGPLVVGFETACWNSVLIRVRIWRECGVLCHRHDGCTLLHTRGFSFPKARLVSDHLDAAKRLAWLQDKWPAILRAATRCKGMRLFEDEASLAQWGS